MERVSRLCQWSVSAGLLFALGVAGAGEKALGVEEDARILHHGSTSPGKRGSLTRRGHG